MKQITLSNEQQELHQSALAVAMTFHKCEWRLIEILREVYQTKLYLRLGKTSLFQYALDELKLTESNAYSFNTLARKSVKVPELLESLKTKDLSVSKATRLVACIDEDNVQELLEFAKSHTIVEIDFEIARRNPKASKLESIRAESGERVRIGFSASKQFLDKTKRAKDIIAQKRLDTDLETLFDFALDELIKKHDPVEKAKRAQARNEKQKSKQSQAMEDQQKTQTPSRTPDSRQPDTPEPLHKQSFSSDVESHTKDTAQSLQKQSSSEVLGMYPADSNNPAPPLHKQSFSNDAIDVSEIDSPAAQPATVMTHRLAKRVRYTSQEKNEVMDRDGGRCTFVDQYGRRCTNERYLHLHHIHPVNLGGSNDPSNLTILCSAHHELVHQLNLPLDIIRNVSVLWASPVN